MLTWILVALIAVVAAIGLARWRTLPAGEDRRRKAPRAASAASPAAAEGPPAASADENAPASVVAAEGVPTSVVASEGARTPVVATTEDARAPSRAAAAPSVIVTEGAPTAALASTAAPLVAATAAPTPALASTAAPVVDATDAVPAADASVRFDPLASTAAPLVAATAAPTPALASTAAPVVAAAAAVPAADASVRFDPLAPRGTRCAELAHHAPEWRAEMATIGERFADAAVAAVVFVHGTFAGNDPLSASRVVERALPSIGPHLARTMRRKTRDYIGRVLGDFGNFGSEYVRLFESAIGERRGPERIPCTEFVWSSENHHVGRLEGALGLVRTLATHTALAPHDGAPRLLLIGHSHAAQVFALATQLFARTLATDAIFDVARARGLDVAALETDLATLEGARVDFVTFGAPARYAWATVANVRALHVIAAAPDGARGALAGDWIRRLGVDGSDFPPISLEDRRVNAALAELLGPSGFAPTRLASALRAGAGLPPDGELVLVDYGDKGLSSAVTSGLVHGAYTRLDAMLFHAKLVADRLYPSSAQASGGAPLPLRADAS